MVPYSELPNGDELRRASHAITRLVAPLEPFADLPGLIEQLPSVSAAVDGFVVAVKPLVNDNRAELVVKSWSVKPIPLSKFTVPAACTKQ